MILVLIVLFLIIYWNLVKKLLKTQEKLKKNKEIIENTRKVEKNKEIIGNTRKVEKNKEILQQVREKYIKKIYQIINIILNNEKYIYMFFLWV